MSRRNRAEGLHNRQYVCRECAKVLGVLVADYGPRGAGEADKFMTNVRLWEYDTRYGYWFCPQCMEFAKYQREHETGIQSEIKPTIAGDIKEDTK